MVTLDTETLSVADLLTTRRTYDPFDVQNWDITHDVFDTLGRATYQWGINDSGVSTWQSRNDAAGGQGWSNYTRYSDANWLVTRDIGNMDVGNHWITDDDAARHRILNLTAPSRWPNRRRNVFRGRRSRKARCDAPEGLTSPFRARAIPASPRRLRQRCGSRP